MYRRTGLLIAMLTTCFLLPGCAQNSPSAPPDDEPEGSEYISWTAFRHHLEVTDAFLTQHTLPGGEDEVVLVGHNGRGLHCGHAVTSTPLFLGTEADLLAVYYRSADYILAGGAREGGSAVLLAYHGEGWQEVSHTAAGNITGIDNNYMCTDEGEILAYSRTGATSVVFQAPAGVRFRAIRNVFGVGTGDFVVGDGGAIYHRVGDGTFVDESIEDGPDFVAVCAARHEDLGPIHIYAVGGDEIWHYFEGVWSKDYDDAAQDLNDIAFFKIDELYAVGNDGLFLRRDEFGWWDDSIDGGADLVAIATSIYPSDDVSKIAFCGSQGEVYRPEGTGWIRTHSQAEESWPAVQTLGAGQTFAAHGNRVMRYMGDDWDEFAVWEWGHEIQDLQIIAPDDIWAIGVMADGVDHFVLHYDGGDWSVIRQASLDGFGPVWSDATAGNVFVTDEMGAIWWRVEGIWELEYLHPENAALYAMAGDSADDLLAVGAGGLVMRRSAGGWATETSGTDADLLAIDGDWVVGENGTVLRYEEGAWSTAGPDWDGRFNDVFVDDLDNVMVVGDDATAFVYDGTEWTRLLTHLPGIDFLSVDSAGVNLVWVGGSEGFMLRSP